MSLLKRSSLLKTLLGLTIISTLNAQPSNSPVVQTQNKLKQIDAQISQLRKTLATANDKRGVLNQELSGTEKQISQGVRQLRTIQGSIEEKQRKIAGLQDKDNQLNKQLLTQQHLLASHVRARYQMGEYQPLKWLINQKDPYQTSRILTYYQYMVKSRQKLIDQIGETRKKINENKLLLNNVLEKNNHLKRALITHQVTLGHTKRYHTTLISSLNNEIQSHQHHLEDAQKNKENLSRLLKTLAQRSVMQSSKPFLRMRKKLPLPVQTTQRSVQKTNQGVTFFAEEGAMVKAVYPGKIVFSNYLKGYGLLLIIDHGQGYMTLYANNQSLLKHKGEYVTQSEHIARVGHTGGIKQNGLYFEVRLKGKAVPPLSWLS